MLSVLRHFARGLARLKRLLSRPLTWGILCVLVGLWHLAWPVIASQVSDAASTPVQGESRRNGLAACPTVNCDCAAMANAQWQHACRKAEQQTQAACTANGGIPNQFCTLQGPNAIPTPFEFTRPAVVAVTAEDRVLGQKHLTVLLWSLWDLRDNLLAREEQGRVAEALDLAKLLDHNLSRVVLAQWQLAEGERARAGDAAAKKLWQAYADEIAEPTALLEQYGRLLWQKTFDAEQATDLVPGTPEALESANRLRQQAKLALNLLRASSRLHEQLAEAKAGAGLWVQAAEQWQQAAVLSLDLQRFELAYPGDADRARYDAYEAAARWYRASFYWIQAQEDTRTRKAVAEAEQVLARLR